MLLLRLLTFLLCDINIYYDYIDILKVNDVGRKIRSTIINFDETDTDSLDYDEMDADKQSEESNHLQPVRSIIIIYTKSQVKHGKKMYYSLTDIIEDKINV